MKKLIYIFIINFIILFNTNHAIPSDTMHHNKWQSYTVQGEGFIFARASTISSDGMYIFFDYMNNNLSITLSQFVDRNIPDVQGIVSQGRARIDNNNIHDINIISSISSGQVYLQLQLFDIKKFLKECINGMILRFEIIYPEQSFYTSFSLNGFTAALNRAMNLRDSLYHHNQKDSSSYFR